MLDLWGYIVFTRDVVGQEAVMISLIDEPQGSPWPYFGQ
jgi:hypothetical protein